MKIVGENKKGNFRKLEIIIKYKQDWTKCCLMYYARSPLNIIYRIIRMKNRTGIPTTWPIQCRSEALNGNNNIRQRKTLRKILTLKVKDKYQTNNNSKWNSSDMTNPNKCKVFFSHFGHSTKQTARNHKSGERGEGR